MRTKVSLKKSVIKVLDELSSEQLAAVLDFALFIKSKVQAEEKKPNLLCVMNETISVLSRRAEEQRRSEQLPLLLDNLLRQVPEQMITWISTETRRLYSDILQLIRQTNGTLNFHDALIALSCRELRIEVIVSFDRDFDQISWLKRIGDENQVKHHEY